MSQKHLWIFVVLLFFILIVAGLLYFAYYESKLEYYTEEQSSWIIREGTNMRIDVTEVSYGYSRSGYGNLVTGVLDEQENYYFSGYYKGEYFKLNYLVEDFLKMSINPLMNTHDGVINVYFVVRKKGGNMTTFIFVDDDFRMKLSRANIFWGENFLFQKKFEYNKISPGIYFTTVLNFPPNKRDLNSMLVVGDIEQNELREGNYDLKTFVIMR